MPNHYETLGVSITADLKEITTAYRKLALKWHPDKNSNNPAAKEVFQKIAEAYEILSDPVRKNRYDQYMDFPNSIKRSSCQPVPSTPAKASKETRQHRQNPTPKAPKKKEPPFDWRTFPWIDASDADKIKAMNAFAQEVNTYPSKNLLPDWLEFDYEVRIISCKSPPDNKGPYVDLELRPFFGESVAKIPVKLNSLLLYRDSAGSSILIRVLNLESIVSLLPEDERYAVLNPPGKEFEKSPAGKCLRNPWRIYEFLSLLNILPPQDQILLCKNYFDSQSMDEIKSVIDRLKRSGLNSPELRLCVALYQVMHHKNVLEEESKKSTDQTLELKKNILNDLLKKIDSQKINLDDIRQALNVLYDISRLKIPRNKWDPRRPKSYSFFNELKVAVETLTQPKPPISSLKLPKETAAFKDSNHFKKWEELNNTERELAMNNFQNQVNRNTPENEVLLAPNWLYCSYDASFYEGNISWNITSEKPPRVELFYYTTRKTGNSVTYQGYTIEEEEKDQKFTFYMNLNNILQYRDERGRDIFGANQFNLILESMPENIRYSRLMQHDRFGNTKLMFVFDHAYPCGAETAQRVLYALPLKERLSGILHIVKKIEETVNKGDAFYIREKQKALKTLLTYLEKNAPDASALNFFKIIQKLTERQSVLNKAILNDPSDLLAFEKYTTLKNVLEKIQDPNLPLTAIQEHLADVLKTKSLILKKRRDWFNPSIPKTYSYLQELHEILNKFNPLGNELDISNSLMT